MKKAKRTLYTLYKSGSRKRPNLKTAETRAVLSSRFKIACIEAGLNIDQVAQMLHVTPRTVRYWFSGKTKVPFAAYKLLRILNRFELPGELWAGWHMHSGKLWTPEGYGFEPIDGQWWSLLVRQARGFRAIYAELCALESKVRHEAASAAGTKELATPVPEALEAPGPAGTVGRREAPPNLFLKHFTTEHGQKTPSTEEKPFDLAATEFIAKLLAVAHKCAVPGGGS